MTSPSRLTLPVVNLAGWGPFRENPAQNGKSLNILQRSHLPE